MHIFSSLRSRVFQLADNNQNDKAAQELSNIHRLNGDIEALHRLAILYLEKKIPCENHFHRAIELFTECANNNNLESQIMLGDIYNKGDHCKRDLELARKWYVDAARQDNHDAAVKASTIRGDEELTLIISRHQLKKLSQLRHPEK